MIVIIFWKMQIFNKNSSRFPYSYVAVATRNAAINVPIPAPINSRIFFGSRAELKTIELQGKIIGQIHANQKKVCTAF
jgi:hypothetical protein